MALQLTLDVFDSCKVVWNLFGVKHFIQPTHQLHVDAVAVDLCLDYATILHVEVQVDYAPSKSSLYIVVELR